MAKESAKKKNTSKTARVLGLLTSPPPTEEPLEPAAAPAPASAAKPKTAAAAPKPADDKVIEAQIRDALASELAAQPPQKEEPAAAARPEPAVEAKPVIQPPAILTEPDLQPLLDEGPAPILTDGPELQPPVLSEEPAPALEEESAPAPEDEAAVQPPLDQEGPALIRPQSERAERPKPIVFQAHPDHIQDSDEGFTCFNVMQALVEAKTEKYIKLFGLCTCSRCRTDVVALALTNLPAKYLVATSKEMVPLLSVYEGQYSAAVISQVMNACRRVMAHPRHHKDQN